MKRPLYIDNSPEPKFRNYFLSGDFQDTQYKRGFSFIDNPVGIIRNNFFFVNFIDVKTSGT